MAGTELSFGGRDSQTSDQFAAPRLPPRQSAPAANDMFSAPGVLSMLKTHTDTGDIGALSFNQNRMPTIPTMARPTRPRRTNPLYMSDISHHTSYSNGGSQASNVYSCNQPWETASSGRRGSFTSLRTTKTMPPYISESRVPSPRISSGRSMPYGPSPAPSQEGRSYSLTQAHQLHPLSVQRSVSSLRSQSTAPRGPPRAPYMYPPRFKRPGYRSVSPAFSDSVGAPAMPVQGRHINRPPLASYHTDYAYGPPPSNQMPTHPQPVYCNMSESPGIPYNEHDRYSHCPPYQQYAHRPVSARRGPPLPRDGALSNGASFFAGMPPGAYTPRAESLPSSSEPGSSAAPSSSNPPTPGDSRIGQARPGPGFVEPKIQDAREDADHTVYDHYINYVKTGETMYELEANYPTTQALEAPQYSSNEGFVQRIKTLLNERAASQHTVTADDQYDVRKLQEKRADVRDPVELPASPVKLTTGNIEDRDQPPLRITRAMVTAVVGQESSTQGTSIVTADINPTATEAEKVQTHSPQAIKSPGRDSVRSVEAHNTDEDFVEDSTVHTGDVVDDSTTAESTQEKDIAGDYAIQIELPVILASRAATYATSSDGCHPISPIKPEDARSNRDSMVSPLPTQTIALSTPRKSQPPGAFPSDTEAQHSEKIKQLAYPMPPVPAASVASQWKSAPYRSLKTDEDQTVAIDIIMDVAKQFPIPRRGNAGKPQIVEITTNLEPTVVRPDTLLHNAIFELPETISPRDSIYSMESVAPLQIKKTTKSIAGHLSVEGQDLSTFIRRSFPRRQSVLCAEGDDLHSAPLNPPHDRRFSNASSGLGHLPRLKEESQEDIPSAAYRTSGFKTPLLRTTQAAQQNAAILNHRAKIPISQKCPVISLSELRNLPSLNFSRMDLVDKLNDALDIRSSRPMEVPRTKRVSAILCPSPIRPSSTEALRERYTSFFAKPEDFHVPTPVDESESFSAENVLSGGQSEDNEDADRVEEHLSSPKFNATPAASLRPLSPQVLLNVASEAQRLSVPSVAGLSQRLSELLPSIKQLHLNSAVADDEAVRNTIDEIHHLGERPETMASRRSSEGFRHMAAVAEDIVANGTHDSAVLSLKARLMKSLPPLPEDTEKCLSDSVGEQRSVSVCAGKINQLPKPKPVLLRTLSESAACPDRLSVPQITLPTSSSKRSTVMSSPTSRPWNVDENYPWSCENVPIEIGMPQKAHCHESISSELLRHAASGSGTGTTIYGDVTRETICEPTVSSASELEPTATVTADTMTGLARKRSIIGSLTRRIGLSTPIRMKVSIDIQDPNLGPVRPHNAGDRYPSTALVPESSFNLEEVRSFFSDDSSHNNDVRPSSFRKHFSQLRSKLPPSILITRTSSFDAEVTRSLVPECGKPAQSLGLGRQSSFGSTQGAHAGVGGAESSAETFEGTAGMGKVEFRVKKVTEKLRSMLAKGGELLRNLGRKRKDKARAADEHDDFGLADSLYSGT